MHPVFYYILFFMAAGAAGMGAANRKVPGPVRLQRWLKYCTYVLVTGTVIAAIFLHFFTGLAFIITGLMLVELFRVNRRQFSRKKQEAVLSFIVFMVVAAGYLLFAFRFSSTFLLFIYFQVLIFDAFCQITGQLWGRRALLPAVSPHKTKEGLAGGWICCIIAAGLAANWVPLPLPAGLALGLFTGLTSFCGDTLSSFYKRRLGIKDFSNWLPGQGGFLDRFDSLLVTGFVYYIASVLKVGFVHS
jgi:phosphatidate cytidylyltransferase